MTDDAMAQALHRRTRCQGPPMPGLRDRLRAGAEKRRDRQRRRVMGAAAILATAAATTLLWPSGRPAAEQTVASAPRPQGKPAAETPARSEEVALHDALEHLRQGTRACAEREHRSAGQGLRLVVTLLPSGAVRHADLGTDSVFARCVSALARAQAFPRAPTPYQLLVEIEDLLPPREVSGPESRADALSQQAMEAYVRGAYKRSIELTGKALQIDPRQPLALRIRGAAFCKLKNTAGALEAIRKTEPQFQNFIKFVCHAEGLDLP